jgi:ABC-2 type transport system ATP-binding protein
MGHRLPKGRSKAMEEVGFVAGYLPLPDRLRVREALGIFAGFYGLDRTQADEAIERGLSRFRITKLGDRMCMELSSGQRTLVGIVKSSLHQPRLLVLDEPTASLDPDVAMRVRTGLLDICANDGTSLLVTSHNMLEVERMCERVVFIAGGRIVADGTPNDVAAMFGHGDLESVFLQLAGSDMELEDDA